MERLIFENFVVKIKEMVEFKFHRQTYQTKNNVCKMSEMYNYLIKKSETFTAETCENIHLEDP